MAFYRPEDQGLIQPRDPGAIAKQSDFGNISSLAIVLLIVEMSRRRSNIWSVPGDHCPGSQPSDLLPETAVAPSNGWCLLLFP